MGAGSLVRERLSFDVLPGGVEGGVLILATGRLSGLSAGDGAGVDREVDGGGGSSERAATSGSRGSGDPSGEISEGDAESERKWERGEAMTNAPPSFDFSETFLVLTVHEDWAGGGRGDAGGKSGSGIFYVRNHIERWRKVA